MFYVENRPCRASSLPSGLTPIGRPCSVDTPELIMTASSAPTSATLAVDHRAARIDLAAAFRWFARLDMHESVANHLSVAVSADGAQFLINPRGRHFARIAAGDLLLLDAHDPGTLTREDAPDPTAWYLHARLHARLPE